jgi:hypothetical protein
MTAILKDMATVNQMELTSVQSLVQATVSAMALNLAFEMAPQMVYLSVTTLVRL